MDAFSDLTPHIKLSFVGSRNENAVFGHGVAELCRGVREFGSLYKAAKSMNMAYSKAWRIMKATEESFGIQLLNRDGAHGSTLTPEGLRLLDIYNEVEQHSSACAQKTLKEALEE